MSYHIFNFVQGFYDKPGGGVDLISKLIEEDLGTKCAALMGANLANEVAEEQFCETTIGSADPETGKLLKEIFHTPNFLVTVVTDRNTVEVCGALKV